jgi:hypothetical protein
MERLSIRKFFCYECRENTLFSCVKHLKIENKFLVYLFIYFDAYLIKSWDVGSILKLELKSGITGGGGGSCNFEHMCNNFFKNLAIT